MENPKLAVVVFSLLKKLELGVLLNSSLTGLGVTAFTGTSF